MAAISHKLQLLQEEGIGDPCLVQLVQFDAYRCDGGHNTMQPGRTEGRAHSPFA